MKLLPIIALTLSSIACFSQDAKPCVAGAALVHVMREKAFTASAVSRSVWFDNIELAKISNGSYFQACLPAGVHHVKVDDNPHGALELDLDVKTEYFLQVSLPLAMFKSHWEVVRIDEPLAASIMERLTPLHPNKVKAHDYVLTNAFRRKEKG